LKTFELFSIIDSESKLELWMIFILVDVKQISELTEALWHIWNEHNTTSVFSDFVSKRVFKCRSWKL